MKKPQIYAHRGASGEYPENTLIAFEQALKTDVDGLELDVQLTKDGELIIIHDETLDRTTNGSGFVKDYTLKELKQLDAGSSFSEQFVGEKMPTLEEVIQLFVKEGHDRTLNIEIKNDVFTYQGIEEKVLSFIQSYQLEKRVIISSFNPFSLQRVRMLHPDIETAFLFMGVEKKAVWIAQEIGANSIHCQAQYVLSEYGDEAKKAGFPLRVFTVNDEKKYKQLVEYGVDSIFTDFPNRFI